MENDNQKTESPYQGAGSRTTVFARIIILGLLLVAAFFFFDTNIPASTGTLKATSGTAEVESPDPFEGLFLEAKAAYVYDIINNEVYFTKNETAQLPLASLTKIMTALVASELLSDDTPVTLTKESVAIEGDSGLKSGERWVFKSLLDYTLLVSSNDGAHAIAGVAGAFVPSEDKNADPRTRFIARMNQKAAELGLEQSFFINESGLDVNTSVSGGYGSVKDVNTLVTFAIEENPALLEATSYNKLDFFSEEYVHGATNTNAIIGKIPGVIGSKTGFTDLAGGNVVMIFDAGINHPIAIVVLGSSYEGRFRDIEKLVNASLGRIAR